MADSVVESHESPVVEKETVTSSVKESPVKESPVKESPIKETNGSNGAGVEKNGSGDVAVAEGEDGLKENGAESEEPKENGESVDACGIKRKSCSGDADTPEVPTPEKKAKLAEEEDCAEESNDAEAVEA